ncbi:single-stranded DNA-binding protein [Nocardioides sp. NBC_00850]|uniref:single-stranded DNA-binding protein n=1 Tax=Nocardioides sp. NBC_00850 TaxID=2976001 RepID=UPI00386EA0C4|nr:single-stranded DNA-binding protein [Nocardioides sp. NBC_00850]
MSIPTQLSLHGYIATTPELTKTRDGSPRFHARIGVEQFRKELDGSFTKLDPVHCDLVAYDTAAERAFERFRVGDCFVAAGYINDYEVDRDGQKVPLQEFVARRIGHDLARTRYEIHRRATAGSDPAPVSASESIDHVIGF